MDLREMGEKLGVSTVLEGSVRKQGNRIRVTAQLINAEDGFHLWSEKYDRNLDDIFAIQDEIALAITEQLKITLLDKDREKITKTSTHNPEAYELYLKGRFYINRRGSSILTGLHFFKQAITVDPSYALAYAGYALANILRASYNFISGKEVMKEVQEATEAALKLDNTIAETYFSLALYYEYFEWNWVEAKKNFIKSIELNPKYTQARAVYAMNLLAWIEGNFDEAKEQGEIAIKQDPFSAIDHADLVWTLHMARRFEEALTYAKIGIELDNNSFLSHRIAGLCYIALQRYEEAIDTFEYLVKISNRHQHALNGLIWAYCSNGDLREAKALMEELEKRAATEYIGATHAGLSVAHLNDLDAALLYIEKAFNDRDPIILALKYSPSVPVLLRNNPRFQNLLDRIGFPK